MQDGRREIYVNITLGEGMSDRVPTPQGGQGEMCKAISGRETQAIKIFCEATLHRAFEKGGKISNRRLFKLLYSHSLT